VESELFADLFRRAGWEIAGGPSSADLLLLNTCAFIAPAVEESLDAVAAAERWKRRRRGRRLILAGCLPGRYPDDGSGGLEIFDLVLRPGETEALAGFLGLPDGSCGQACLGHPTHRYLRIADGCSNACRYCTIPMIRGAFRAEPRQVLMQRASELVSAGAAEIGVVAHDPGSWRDGEGDLCTLVESLAVSAPSVLWRLYYLHPSHFPRRLVELVSGLPNLAPWMDLPIQHASDRVLAAMRRPYGRRLLEDIAGRLEGAPRTIALRATVIAGYPGESEEDFESLLDFLGSLSCLRSLVVFQYSPEEGTAQAAAGEREVPPDEAFERAAILGSLGEEAAARWAETSKGRTIRVVSDTALEGHSEYDAPEVEGRCRFTARVDPGRVITCRVEDAQGLDMTVSPLDRGN